MEHKQNFLSKTKSHLAQNVCWLEWWFQYISLASVSTDRASAVAALRVRLGQQSQCACQSAMFPTTWATSGLWPPLACSWSAHTNVECTLTVLSVRQSLFRHGGLYHYEWFFFLMAKLWCNYSSLFLLSGYCLFWQQGTLRLQDM